MLKYFTIFLLLGVVYSIEDLLSCQSNCSPDENYLSCLTECSENYFPDFFDNSDDNLEIHLWILI